MAEEKTNNAKETEEQKQPEAAPVTESEVDQKEETVEAGTAEFEDFDESFNFNTETLNKLDYLNDLQLNIYIELGRTKMKIKDILELERGYVIELDKLASEPVDIFVNNKKIAEGEVVVIDKHFGIRIVNLVDPKKMMQGLA
jgi:flagellar motor switch protein FliN/FliY